MDQRPSADALLERIKETERARLRIYIGAAPGVGKTYEMLRDAHALRARGLDVVVGLVETYGRTETEAQVGNLEVIPRRRIEYRGVTLEEMDVDTIIRRKPELCVVDELAHSNVPGSRHEKRYEDVIEILDAGIHVMTAVNIQHLETLNDAVAKATGVRVRETVPDTFLRRADEVVPNDELHTRALALAAECARGPVLSQAFAKQAIDRGLSRSLADGLRLEQDLFVDAFATNDSQIGVKSFLEHGPGKAKFTGT